MLCATTPCTLPSSQLPKTVRQCCVFAILTSKCASRQHCVHFLNISAAKSAPDVRCFYHFDFEMFFAQQRRAIFHLSSPQMATRRFSEPTSRPPGATKHWKNTMFRDFSTFSRASIFFLLILSLLWSSFYWLSLLWLFPPLLFHVSILSEIWLLNFLRWETKFREFRLALNLPNEQHGCSQRFWRKWAIAGF